MKYSQAAVNDSVFNYLQKDALPVFLGRLNKRKHLGFSFHLYAEFFN